MAQEYERPLESAARQCQAVAATIHRRDGDYLVLMDHVRIPPATLGLIKHIPRGKGMAGQAWEQGRSVTTCNLREDPNEMIQPGARLVQGVEAIAVPVHDTRGEVAFVVGFSFGHEHKIDAALERRITQLARWVADRA